MYIWDTQIKVTRVKGIMVDKEHKIMNRLGNINSRGKQAEV